MSPRKTAAAGERDRSAQHGWNATPGKSRARTVTAAVRLTDKQKIAGARVLARLATSPDELRDVLDAAGLDLAELRTLRALGPASEGTP